MYLKNIYSAIALAIAIYIKSENDGYLSFEAAELLFSAPDIKNDSKMPHYNLFKNYSMKCKKYNNKM